MGADSVYALLADGITVEIRPAAAGDFEAVAQMHRAMSPDNSYFRFFSWGRAVAEREARRICREPGADHVALLAWQAGELVGVAGYEAGGKPGTAEIAFAVADRAQHRGVATLLLEHLVSAARDQGVRTFAASVLPENFAMLKVFADAGIRARRTHAEGVTELVIDLPGDVAHPRVGAVPGCGGDAGGPRRCGEPAACVRGGVGGGGGGQPPGEIGRLGGLAQSGHRRVPRAAVCGSPARP